MSVHVEPGSDVERVFRVPSQASSSSQSYRTRRSTLKNGGESPVSRIFAIGPMLALFLAGRAPVVGPPVPTGPHSAAVQQTDDGAVLGAIGARDANIIEVTKLVTSKASGSAKSLATMVLKDHQLSPTAGAQLATELHVPRLLPADWVAAHPAQLAGRRSSTAATSCCSISLAGLVRCYRSSSRCPWLTSFDRGDPRRDERAE
jgi:hypothetical protein